MPRFSALEADAGIVPWAEVYTHLIRTVIGRAGQARHKSLADICLEASILAKRPDSEATAGIEPAMKVLQTAAPIREPRPKKSRKFETSCP